MSVGKKVNKVQSLSTEHVFSPIGQQAVRILIPAHLRSMKSWLSQLWSSMIKSKSGFQIVIVKETFNPSITLITENTIRRIFST